MRPDKLCPRGWRELANITARPLSSLKDCGNPGKSLMTGKVKSIFKKRTNDMRSYRLINLPFVPKKVKQQVHLDQISEHTKEKKETGNTEHELTERIFQNPFLKPIEIVLFMTHHTYNQSLGHIDLKLQH
ncbi:hypothetical protein llap_12483 [Limosa lapponica baueri]|uniref:Uncharacterized protein n=1 Tax=Limosa lapponica baueri TaxID=1758121 RepID=A0A2I0TTS5_LIMLA|nr:hypothetical protein llap_12483 [Limosa lapponica baueri]